MPYVLMDSALEADLQAARGDDPSQLADECALLRALIQRFVNEGKFSAAERLLSCLQRMSAAHTTAQMRHGQLLAKSQVIEIAGRFTEALETALRAHGLDEQLHDRICDAVIEQIPAIVDPKLLTYEERQ